MDVSAITEVAFTSEDRGGDVIRNFNRLLVDVQPRVRRVGCLSASQATAASQVEREFGSWPRDGCPLVACFGVTSRYTLACGGCEVLEP
jgi:hypothetical protein